MPYWYTSAAQNFITDGKGSHIPCVASNADWLRIQAAGEIIFPPPPPVTMPHVISRWQCAVQLREMALITEAEALAMISQATPPAYVEALLASLPANEQQDAREAFGASKYEFDSPHVDRMLPAGTTADQKADFFRAAGQRKP